MNAPLRADGTPGPASKRPRVIVIGAGMSGMLMGYQLKQAGFDDFVIYEKGASVGGTWRENQYPGLHCDVPSHNYCYSFALNPDWSKHFSPGPEIWAYFQRMAERMGVASRIRFNTRVVEGRWDGARWTVRLSDGSEEVADILVSATGILHVPTLPDIPGLDSFKGAKFHTTGWDLSLPLGDKRIGIIGTGSTAIQIVAELSAKVRGLVLFQRTAQWVAKAPNERFAPWQKLLFRLFPFVTRRLYTKAIAMTKGITDGIMGADPEARAALEKNVQDNLASVKDPELRAKLTPTHEVGCKRLILSPNFYEAIQHPSCRLVTDAIDHIEPRGVVTKDGRLHELDVLALATGFDITAYVRPVRLYGKDGRDLEEVWSPRAVAYHSITVPDMPNFFMIGGPFSPIANMSIILMSEAQVGYIMKCIEIIAERGIAMSPRREVTDAMIAGYREAAKHSIWAIGGCRSYYQDKDGVPQIYPFGPDTFREETMADPVLGDYEITPLTRVAAG